MYATFCAGPSDLAGVFAMLAGWVRSVAVGPISAALGSIDRVLGRVAPALLVADAEGGDVGSPNAKLPAGQQIAKSAGAAKAVCWSVPKDDGCH